MLERFGPPNAYDHAPKGTILRVGDQEPFDIYIQSSDKEDEPRWEFVDSFTEASYQFYLEQNK